MISHDTSIAENVYFRRAAPGEGGARGFSRGRSLRKYTLLRCVVHIEE